ncbi:hypothetical protein WMF39_25360 [Sorangium sp. So ce1504]|uniref:hypothetical protein n=1 Tax=Sorangium sp. So ce1504 TaxID=3133337 RepID=UPI003F6188F5
MTRAACDLRDPSELSTAELRQRCRGCKPWELGLGAVQLAASAAAGGAVLAAAGACIPGLVQCISVGPALAAGLAVWESIGVASGWLPGAAYRDELAFRAWHAGLSPWVGPAAQRRWARRALARRPAAPDWLLVLEGVAPAGGGRRWVKVELSLSPSSDGPFRSQASGHALLRAGGDGAEAPHERRLAIEELDDLRRAVAELPEALSLDPPASPRDPAVFNGRCELLIARRTPFAAAQLTSAFPSLEAGPQAPSQSLLHRLVQLAWRGGESGPSRRGR